MRHILSVRAAVPLLVAAALATLAGCGTGATPPGATNSPAPPVPFPSASTSPAPVPSSPPAQRVVASRVSYAWHWPDDVTNPGAVRHSSHVPPVPELIAVSAGDHPADPGDRPYNRLSFTFTHAFPSYEFASVGRLVEDPSGKPVRLAGTDMIKLTFRGAQAHTVSGASSVSSQPPAQLGMTRMVAWAPVGDFEGVLTYGIGIQRPILHSNPQIPMRAIEVEKVTAQGQHLYVVAIDIEA